MEEKNENLEQLEIPEGVEVKKTSIRKKILKRVLIRLGLIIGFWILRFLSTYVIDYFVSWYWSSKWLFISTVFSILIAFFTEILIAYLIVLRKTKKYWDDEKLKRLLKFTLIIFLPILLVSAFMFFKNVDIEIPEKHHCWPQKKYNWKNEKCYQKCKDWCSYEDCYHIMGASCSEDCDRMCEVPKYENCISKCKKPKIKWYDKDNYNLWYEQQSNEKFSWFWWLWDLVSYYWNYDIVLIHKNWYDEWINQNFSWHIDELKKYESCLSKCWDAPSYIRYYKPIIYLYPTSESEIHVNLWTPENLSHTYPKYNSEKWRNVIAQPNGDLEDIETWRKLYALYREWKSNNETNFDEWFVVAWKDIIPFLEEKLAILGLNEREAEEFIVYWLPQMEGNEWNLIRFESIEEQNENMPLNITPIPDTVIRVMMDWKSIDEPINIPEQQLTTPERNGFTVVEWWWSPKN